MPVDIKAIQAEFWTTIIQPKAVLEGIEKGQKFVCETDLLLDLIRLLVRERMKEFEAFNESCLGMSSKVNFITNELCGNSPARDKNWYESVIYLPFENIEVPAPAGYDELLKCQYGNYMEFVKGGSFHNGIILDPDTPYYLFKRGINQ